MCSRQRANELTALREQLLAGFVERVSGSLVIRASSEVPDSIVSQVEGTARRPNVRFFETFGVVPTPLTVYIYASSEELHRYACINAAADAYYDGAVHLSAVTRDGKSIVGAALHEFAHHALKARGVTQPTWLHEGLAMYVARETWWRNPKWRLFDWGRTEHLPFASMTLAFPDGADEAFALKAYFQSLMMVRAIILHHRGQGGLFDATPMEDLFERLASGATTPEDAFAYALQADRDEALEQAWQTVLDSPED